ncbi:hypothetical protein HHK36_028285 [Tetracentron sinense]|uniref:Cadmium-induced protein AS8 n=1 Tax=Tetracentron sinense TaxID=13715 RepID=A0A834YJN7_TETSI|nr:hypothetical protein HHK36_028285 [Tetracentron sinense]
MIIKGLFRRYERWNPVHPTSGAFWGMGIGIGCGVGWGPGFGPEVIGYVGSGCGIGFSVGIMLAGVGIGLPANWLIVAPYNGHGPPPQSTVFDPSFTTTRISAGEGWNHIAPHVCGLRREVIGRLSCFNRKHSLDQGISLTEMMNKMPFRARSVLECLGAFREHCLRLHKDLALKGLFGRTSNSSPIAIC